MRRRYSHSTKYSKLAPARVSYGRLANANVELNPAHLDGQHLIHSACSSSLPLSTISPAGSCLIPEEGIAYLTAKASGGLCSAWNGIHMLRIHLRIGLVSERPE